MGEVLHSEWQTQAQQALADAGYRNGAARRAVIDALASQQCCASASEISALLAADGNDVGIASVYRALEVLDQLHLLQRLDVGDGTTRYEAALPSGDHHHHLVCDKCGKVVAFEDHELEKSMHTLTKRLGFSVSTHDVTLHGACETCAASS